jgi:hypothetical protein
MIDSTPSRNTAEAMSGAPRQLSASVLAIPEGASALLTAARPAELSKAETRAAGPKMVRCVTCRHLDPNRHSPALGWCGCNAGKGGGWPSAPRTCSDFREGTDTGNGGKP